MFASARTPPSLARSLPIVASGFPIRVFSCLVGRSGVLVNVIQRRRSLLMRPLVEFLHRLW